MITVLIILGSILLIISWLLFASMTIKVDTSSNIYYVKIPVIFKSQLIMDDQGRRLRISIFFIPFSVNLDKKTVQKVSGEGSVIDKARKKISLRMIMSFRRFIKMISVSLDFAKGIIKTFRIKCLKINFDTGDYIFNSQLIPLLMLINHRNIEV